MREKLEEYRRIAADLDKLERSLLVPSVDINTKTETADVRVQQRMLTQPTCYVTPNLYVSGETRRVALNVLRRLAIDGEIQGLLQKAVVRCLREQQQEIRRSIVKDAAEIAKILDETKG